MPDQSRDVAPGPGDRQVRLADGRVLNVPADWALLPPGDAGLTRRVKAGGPTWTMKRKQGRRLFSLGVWAPAARIAKIEAEWNAVRSTEKYAKAKAAGAKRREAVQDDYVQSFDEAVRKFLRFAPCYTEWAHRLSAAVVAHATPVGSGTVARTKRIPIEQRAEAAVVAWMRHQTTAYDDLKIARVKGKRREVRRMLAAQSHRLLEQYRAGRPIDLVTCPLHKAIAKLPPRGATTPTSENVP